MLECGLGDNTLHFNKDLTSSTTSTATPGERWSSVMEQLIQSEKFFIVK